MGSSDKLTPTPVDAMITMMMPYTSRTGLPELMPVAMAADSLNHELVKLNAVPRIESTEKPRESSWV